MKTKAEIVVETLNFYNKNNRGYNAEKNECTYYDESTGNKCAVGRCILDSKLENILDFEKNNDLNSSVKKLDEVFKGLDSLLKPEYRGHDVHFWSYLQCIHDNSYYWNEDGVDYSSCIDKVHDFFGEEVADAVSEAFNKDPNPNLLEKTA